MTAAIRSHSHLTSPIGGPHAGHEQYGSQGRRTA
jgi:hypothetical protein